MLMFARNMFGGDGKPSVTCDPFQCASTVMAVLTFHDEFISSSEGGR